MVALRDELITLREELAAYIGLAASEESSDVDMEDQLSGVLREDHNGNRAANGNSNAIRRSAKQVKHYAAA
jgi:hypothetical protein